MSLGAAELLLGLQMHSVGSTQTHVKCPVQAGLSIRLVEQRILCDVVYNVDFVISHKNFSELCSWVHKSSSTRAGGRLCAHSTSSWF